EILADRLRTRAALRDTVSVLRLEAAIAAAAARARVDSLAVALRWATLDLDHERETRPRWYERPAIVVPTTMLLTILAIDVTVGD
ncbi:MAG TPA: hypothetical protein PLL30_17390, partial [Candidatus Krumholzibacteria bacterium]|nr:hypothetical protein [Candidatus Krumholzibacteria bacterium]